AAMVVLIFISIFVGRRLSRPLGAAIAICAAVFLYFSHAKSPLILLPIVLFLSYLVPRVRSRFLSFALVLGTPFLITLLSVGSVMFGPIKTLVSAVLPDPTFTGRDEIWLFALDHIAERPLFGFGFESFWGTPAWCRIGISTSPGVTAPAMPTTAISISARPPACSGLAPCCG